MKNVYGIGKLNIDLIYSGLPRLPEIGEEVYSEDFGVYLGGGTPGTLINLFRLGAPVKLLTYLDDGMFSDFAKNQMELIGLPFVNVYDGGERAINISSAMLTPSDRTFVSFGKEITVNSDKVYAEAKNADIFIMEDGRYADVYERLKKEGKILVFDPGYTDTMSLASFGKFLTLCDYYLPNRLEALTLTGESSVRAAAIKLSAYLKDVIIKLDQEGALLYSGGEFRIIESPNEFTLNYKDSTGAGDAFFAGFLYGLAGGYPAADCILFGNLTGGKCVTGIGCLSAYFTEKELLTYFELIKNKRF